MAQTSHETLSNRSKDWSQMSAVSPYAPPPSSEINKRQNNTDALRLLIAQRRLYSRAKRWLAFSWMGMVTIGIAAPIVSVVWPSLTTAVGAIAGVWLFLGRTWLLLRQTTLASRAAAIQEQFDLYVFGMPNDSSRSELPSLEEISKLAGADHLIGQVAKTEGLLDWYPIDSDIEGGIAVAIAQRANASYSHRLLKTTATVWSLIVVIWAIALVVVSVVVDLSLEKFLLGVAMPVLPAYLDVVQYVAAVRRSATERSHLVGVIEDCIDGKKGQFETENLLVWQARLFELRRSAPEVPDIVYRLTRRKNEEAMHSVARGLSAKAKDLKQ
jgi:hypothetical protein